jgi:hypothetical protein
LAGLLVALLALPRAAERPRAMRKRAMGRDPGIREPSRDLWTGNPLCNVLKTSKEQEY